MHAVSADPHAELIEIPHLTHYSVDQPEGLGQIIEHLRSWLVGRELVG
jgi:hypothetical protein